MPYYHQTSRPTPNRRKCPLSEKGYSDGELTIYDRAMQFVQNTLCKLKLIINANIVLLVIL